MTVSNRRRILLIFALLIGAAIGAILPFLLKERGGDPAPPCCNHLKGIDSAKAFWAMDQRRTTDDIPTDSDLFGHGRPLAEKPVCPQGGKYIIGKVGEKPRCTFPGHSL